MAEVLLADAEAIEEGVGHLNAALAKKPAAMRVCTHMCRGNFKSSWVATGSYEHVAEALFTICVRVRKLSTVTWNVRVTP